VRAKKLLSILIVEDEVVTLRNLHALLSDKLPDAHFDTALSQESACSAVEQRAKEG
jgi:DNA-binding LytR/AlgR family response regulator